MLDIEIKKVESKKDLLNFIKFPWKIYKDNPHWVPPLIFDQKKIFNKKINPFFSHGDMDLFIAYSCNDIVGRIAAISNNLHNKVHNEKIGFFGFFESIDNQLVANKLFKAVEEWCKERNFIELRGPANPSSNDEYGLLVEGFEDSPRILMTYNPRYYIVLFENSGFQKAKDLYAYKLIDKKVISSEKLVRGAELIRKRYNLKIRPIDMKNFKTDLENFKYVYNKAWQPNWGFVPMTDEEIDYIANNLKMFINPNLIIYGYTDGKLITAAFVLPDYNYVLKGLKGRIFPNIIKFPFLKKKIKWARIITLGVIPEYQKKGIDSFMYFELHKRIVEAGYYQAEASWILEDNVMMLRGAEQMNAEIYKTYRIYSKNI
ncbi:MAG: hypothetical protein JW866_05985 [Ignavibacteriales bacterium]|nr:hypothetical protein [Ignavibacteriales bacterium]